MNRRKTTRVTFYATLSVAGLLVIFLAGCLRVSNGTWYVKEAPLPAGWPPLTPIGEVEIKQYPAYRAATVTHTRLEDHDTEAMFSILFDHIKRAEIAMTAPVEMEFRDATDKPRMTSMAFLYRTTDLGRSGTHGSVRVEDLAPQTFASVGVRGPYTSENYTRGLQALQTWLADHDAWQAAGPARYLGYNGPFVLPFARYGEVQMPVTDGPAVRVE